MTHPTAGLLPVCPRLRRPRRSAAAIMRRSNSGSIGTVADLPARVAILSAFGDLASRLAGQLVQHGLEVLRVAEVAVHRSETHVSHLVEVFQALHHQAADSLGGNVAVAARLELAHNAVDHALDALRLDRALADGELDRPRQLITVEWLATAALLDHRQVAQLHALERGEPSAAYRADAAAANGGVVLRRTRILYLGVGVAAERTAHGCGRVRRYW